MRFPLLVTWHIYINLEPSFEDILTLSRWKKHSHTMSWETMTSRIFSQKKSEYWHSFHWISFYGVKRWSFIIGLDKGYVPIQCPTGPTVYSRPSHAHWAPAHWDLHTGPPLPATTSIDQGGNCIFALCWRKCNILMYKTATHRIWLSFLYYLYFLISDMCNYIKIYT